MTVWRGMALARLARLALAGSAWFAFAPDGAEAAEAHVSLRYDIQVAWIPAGEIVMTLTQTDDRYALSGTVATSRLMERFFVWHGRFVSTGRFRDRFPHTDAYMLWGRDDDGLETLLSFGGRTTIRTPGRAPRYIDQPAGSDFMSVTFLSPHCVRETTLHDGKHIYRLRLEDSAEDQRLERRTPYYSGLARRCDYRFGHPSGTTRRLSLWVASWQGREIPVRLRVRFPFLPDGHLHLRVQDLDAKHMETGHLGR